MFVQIFAFDNFETRLSFSVVDKVEKSVVGLLVLAHDSLAVQLDQNSEFLCVDRTNEMSDKELIAKASNISDDDSRFHVFRRTFHDGPYCFAKKVRGVCKKSHLSLLVVRVT